MSLLADALQPLMVSGIHGTTGPYEAVSLSDSIISPKAAYSIIFHASTKQIDTKFSTPDHIRYLIAADCRRLAVSCLQSVNFLWPDENEKFSLPWTLIRLYYSAFYAGHVIVRLLGSGCCWLDSSHTKKLAMVGRIYNNNQPPPFTLEAGSYQCLVTDNAKTLQWTKTLHKGAHESLWAIFNDVINLASEKILSGKLATYDAQQVFAKLDGFRRLSASNKSESWLSRTRNELQYRMEHGVWHATEFAKDDRLKLKKLANQWQNDPMSIELLGGARYGSLGQFTVACAFIVAVFRVMILRVEELSSYGKGSFVRHGPRTLTNDFRLQI